MKSKVTVVVATLFSLAASLVAIRTARAIQIEENDFRR